MMRTLKRSRVALVALLVAGTSALASGRSADAEAPSSTFRLETLELPSPLVDTSTPGGRLARGRTVPKVHVLLPAGYDEHPDARYPVLWLLHGANGGTDSWLPSITRLLDGLPAILVMPDGGVFGMYTDWWNGGRRGGPAWASYHLGFVRDTIEQRYRIRPERRWHAIGGISMGGGGALRYAAMLPGYFGSVASFSAAIPDWQTVEAYVGLTALAAAGGNQGVTYEAVFGPMGDPYVAGNSPRALAPNYEHTRMYVTSGTGLHCGVDPVRPDAIVLDTITETVLHTQQDRFANTVRRAGADVTAVPTCGSHTFGVWDRAIPAARRWGFFEPVPEHPRHWTYRTVATAGEAWGLRYRFDEPPKRVVELSRDGDAFRATGSGRLRLRGPAGCDVELRLPFRGSLPAACFAAED